MNYKTNTPYSHLNYYAEHIPIGKNTHTYSDSQTQTYTQRDKNSHGDPTHTPMDTCRHTLLEF